jgi:hypothetical protein
MSAAQVLADALHTEIVGHTGDANGGRITRQAAEHFGGKAVAALEENGYGVVQLPEEHFAGDYALVHIEADEIQIDVDWIDTADDARKVAAALLRAADQLEKQLAEERGPDGGELDWGARADDARDAQVDRENGVTP